MRAYYFPARGTTKIPYVQIRCFAHRMSFPFNLHLINGAGAFGNIEFKVMRGRIRPIAIGFISDIIRRFYFCIRSYLCFICYRWTRSGRMGCLAHFFIKPLIGSSSTGKIISSGRIRGNLPLPRLLKNSCLRPGLGQF